MSIKFKVRQGGASASQPDLANLAEAREGVPVFASDGTPLIDMAQRWEMGQAGQGSYTYVDVDGSLSYFHRPHAEVKLIEDESGTDYIIGWGRMEGGNDVARPTSSASGGPGHGTVEHNAIQVMDCNIDLRGLPFRTAWERPAETTWQRLQALELRSLNGSSSTGDVHRATTDITINNFTGGNHLVDASSPVDMDAHTYPAGTFVTDVMEDIFTQWEGKRWGVTIHHTDSGSHKCLLVLDPDDNETFQSELKISDHLEDWDPDDTDAPVLAPEWRRGAGKISDNTDVISGVISIYGGTNDNPRHTYVETGDSEDEWETWVDVYNDDIAKNETQAERRANKILADRKRPYVTPQPSITLNPDQVTLITAGQSIEVKSVVINQGPDRAEYQWWRIAEIRWEPLPDGRWRAHLELGRAKNARGANGGGGPGQPGSTSPKPPPFCTPDPGDTLDGFFNANDAGGDAENWTGILGNQSAGAGTAAAGTTYYYFKSSAPTEYQNTRAWTAGDSLRVEGYIGCRTATGAGLKIAFSSAAAGSFGGGLGGTILEEHTLATNPAKHSHNNEWTFFTVGPFEAPVGTNSYALGKVGSSVNFDEVSVYLVGTPADNDEFCVPEGSYDPDNPYTAPAGHNHDTTYSPLGHHHASESLDIAWKAPVRVATTANGTLASAFDDGSTVDGVTLATGDRILIKNQSTPGDNGIYVVAASGAPVRAGDFDEDTDVSGAMVRVMEGTANADTVWGVTDDDAVIGTDDPVFAEMSGGSGSVATDTIWDAKGDLAVGTGADTASKLTAGSDDTILMADSSTGTGLKWVASASPSAVGTAAATGTSDTFTRGDHVHAHETGHVAHDTIFDAKGDLVAGTGADASSKLTVGTNDYILMADSGETTGLKWVAPATPSAVGTAGAEGTADTYTRGDHVHAHEAAHINHDTTWAAKGDLIVGTANDTASVLTVGTDNKVLTANSGESTGLKWTLVSDIPSATNVGWIDSSTNPDKPPGSPNAVDDEFDAGSLDGKWTHSGGNTPTFADSKVIGGGASAGAWTITQTFQPGASTAFTIKAKFTGVAYASATDLCGISVLDSGSSNIIQLDHRLISGGARLHKDVGGTGTDIGMIDTRETFYLELARDASNVYSFRFSSDGVTWSTYGMATSTSATTVDKLRIKMETTRASTAFVGACDWIRRTV